MTEPNAQLVRRLRTSVRQLVKANPALRRERKKIRAAWRRALTTHWTRIIPALLISSSAVTLDDPLQLTSLLALWSLIVTLARTQQIVTLFTTPVALWNFYLLPVENAATFRHQARLVLRSSLWLGVDWLVFGIIVALRLNLGVTWLAVPLVVIGQTATALAVATAFARWRPRLPWGGLAILLGFVLFVLLRALNNTTLASVAAPLLNGLQHFTPAGWLATSFIAVCHGQPLGWLGLVAGAAGSAMLARWLAHHAAKEFSVEEVFGYNDGTEGPATGWISAEADAEAPPTVVAEPEPLPPAEALPPVDLGPIRTALHRRLEEPAGLALFHRGWLEASITRLLSERRRVLLDVLLPAGFPWGRGWLIALIATLGAHLLHVAGFGADWEFWLPCGSILMFGVPAFGGAWNSFAQAGNSFGRPSLPALFPIGFGETATTILLVNTLRCIAGLPLIVVAIRYGFTAEPVSWPVALDFTWRALALLLAVQPIWVLFMFSKTTNDSATRWWFSLLAIGVLVSIVVCCVGLATALFYADDFVSALACGLVLLLLPLGTLTLYGWVWGRAIFDVMGKAVVS